MSGGLRVGGLDSGLTQPGMAVICGGELITWAYRTKKLRGYERQESIIEQVLAMLGDCHVVAVEGLAFGAKGSAVLDLAGMRAILCLELHRAGIPVIDLPPSVVKKYATGSGSADKAAMLGAAIRRLEPCLPAGQRISTEDEADAAWCAAATADYYGFGITVMPKAHRDALLAVSASGRRKGLPVVTWPDVPGDMIEAAAKPARADTLFALDAASSGS